MREDLPNDGGIVQRGDEPQPLSAVRACQDVNGKRCGIGSWGGPGGAVSENGRLRQGTGGPSGRQPPRYHMLMLTILAASGARLTANGM